MLSDRRYQIGNVGPGAIVAQGENITIVSVAHASFELRSASALGLAEPVLREPILEWFPLLEAFEDGEPNLFSLLRWDYRLLETLYGRDDDLRKILAWAENGSRVPSVCLITGEGGAGKTRLAATAAQILRDKGWTAGFLPRQINQVNFNVAEKGLFLILDYPEEQPTRTTAILQELAERRTAPYPLRVMFLSRRSFEEWERETTILQGRFGRQEIAAPAPLNLEDGASLIAEAAHNFVEHTKKPLPDLGSARRWLEASPTHRLPLYAMAAAVHAVLSPTEAFGLGGGQLIKNLALREIERVGRTSQALALGRAGLERLLALAVLADGLSERAVTELAEAGACEQPKTEFVEVLSRSPWWSNGHLMRLQPDPLAAAFLDLALFDHEFPRGRDALTDWMFIALQENAPTFGNRLGRILYDLQSLHQSNEGVHPLDDRVLQMVLEKPERAMTFAGVAISRVPFLAANFAAQIALTGAQQAAVPEAKAIFFNSAANNLAAVGRREDALSAAQEATHLFRELARAQPDAFTAGLATALNNLGNRLSDLGRWEEALSAAQEAANIDRELARAQPETFVPGLAGSLTNLASRLADVGRWEEALATAQEAVNIYRALAGTALEEFASGLLISLNNIVLRLSALGRREEALAPAQEAVTIGRELVRTRPEAFMPHLALSAHQLAKALSELGRWEEALVAARESTEIYRELARARPEAFKPQLAASLTGLAVHFSNLGRRKEALAAAQESVNIRRDLVLARPEAFTPDLAISLNNLGIMLAALGRGEEAVAAAQEAVNTYRELARTRPDAFMPDLAMSLKTLGVRLSALEHWEAAMAAGQEAVNIYRELAHTRPNAFMPNLAGSLNDLVPALATLRRWEEALAAAQEAVNVYRELVRTQPEAFMRDLAPSLNNLASVLSALGHLQEAAAVAQETVNVRRELARAQPEAFTPDLAGSLSNLANILSSLGRLEEALAPAQEAVNLYR